MTTTLYCPVPYSGVISQGYTVTQTGTPVPDNLVQAIMSAAYTAGVVLTTSAGGTPAVVQSTSWFNAGTGAPTSGSWSAGMEVRDSTGAEFVCTVSGTPGTWVAVSGGGGGALPTQTGNAHKLLGTDGTSATWKAAPVIDAADYGVVGDNSTVNTTALQAALDASPYPVSGLAGNDVPARIVQLPPGRIKTGTVTVSPNTWLRGHGPSGTYLVNSSTTADTIALAAGAVQVTISDLGIIGSGSASAGSAINLGNSNAASILGDNRNIVRDVVIVAGYQGVTGSGHTEERLVRVAVYRTVYRGIWVQATDMFISDCTVAQPGDVGFYIAGANTRMWGCKAFGGTSTAPHFVIGGAGRHEVSVCESQDGSGVGFSVSTNDPSVISDCIADSCAGVGFSGDSDAGANQIINCHVVARSGGAHIPTGGLLVRSSSTRARITTKGAFPALSTSSTFGFGEQVDLNNETGYQKVSYAASVTLDPYAGGVVYLGALTGNLTLANPAATNGSPFHYNQRLRVVLTQDATGGRTVTFGTKLAVAAGSVNTAASATSVLDFVYDPAADVWRQASSNAAASVTASSPVTTVAAASTAQTLTFPSHGTAAYDLTGSAASCTSTLAGGTAGEECWLTLYLHQDNTGGRSWVFPGGVRWPNGNVTPAFSTNPGQYDIVSLVTTDGGASFSGFLGGTGWQAPALPSAASLSATAGDTQNVLTWTAAAGNGASVTGYKVYAGGSTGTETLLTTVGNVLTYTHTGLTNGTIKYYKVSAVNSVGEGPLSNEVSATPAAGGVTTIATDAFTLSDSTTGLYNTTGPVGKTTDTGSKTWVVAASGTSGNWGISTNAAYQASGNGSAYIDAGVNDYTIQADVIFSGAPNDAGIAFRLTDGNNWLNFMVDPAGFYIQKKVAGTQTNAANVAATNTTGTYTLKVVVSGTSVTCFSGGVQKLTYTITDTALQTASKVGLHGIGVAATTAARWDNFSVTTP